MGFDQRAWHAADGRLAPWFEYGRKGIGKGNCALPRRSSARAAGMGRAVCSGLDGIGNGGIGNGWQDSWPDSWPDSCRFFVRSDMGISYPASESQRGVQIVKGRIAVLLLLHALLASGYVAAVGACDNEDHVPHIEFDTSAGQIEVRLFPAAAPESVELLIGLVKGPIFNPGLSDGLSNEDSGPGYYDGLTFNFVNPHLEIRTSQREPGSAFRLPMEIDADALGLDEQLVDDSGEAMDIWQFELFPFFTEHRNKEQLSTDLVAWVTHWRSEGNVDFLQNVSRKRINEAQNFQYSEGLSSRPAARGAVALSSAGSRRSTPRLRFFLTDFPQLTGRITVIGEVTKGLDIVEQIAQLAVIPPPYADRRARKPIRPPTINKAIFVCTSSTEEGLRDERS